MDRDELLSVLRPFAEFSRKLERKPLGRVSDQFYGIHSGTEWEASLSFSNLAAARRAYEALSTEGDGWQDIATAPSARAGDELILIYRGGNKVETALPDGEWWRKLRVNGSKTAPTHWRPLPAPPSASS
jgi:hypothetical protein